MRLTVWSKEWLIEREINYYCCCYYYSKKKKSDETIKKKEVIRRNRITYKGELGRGET